MYVDEIELPNGETDFVEKEMDKKYYCLTVTDKATVPKQIYIYIYTSKNYYYNIITLKCTPTTPS